jgi:hypothetical protein
MKKSLFSLLLISSASLISTSSYAAFVDYAGTGTMNGQAISMTMQIDNDFGPSVWYPPEHYVNQGAHPRDLPFDDIMIGNYTITLDGAGTTSGDHGRLIMWWDLVGDSIDFYNDETILYNDDTFSGSFAHSGVDFMDGTGNPYDFSSWQDGGFELPPEIAFNRLNLNSWGGYAGSSSIDLHLHAVPLPAGLWLFGTGLIGLLGVARKRISH